MCAWLAGAGRADCLRGERLTPVIERGGESGVFFRHSRPRQANYHVAEVFGLAVAESPRFLTRFAKQEAQNPTASQGKQHQTCG